MLQSLFWKIPICTYFVINMCALFSQEKSLIFSKKNFFLRKHDFSRKYESGTGLQGVSSNLNLQKGYCMKTKVIALDWQWVTLRSWCQMNHNSHSSPVKHKVDDKPHNIFEKLKITSGNSTFFGHFLWSIFRSPVFTSVFLLIKMILPLKFTHGWPMLIFSSLYRWIFGDSAFVLGHANEKEKNKSIKLVSREGYFFFQSDF